MTVLQLETCSTNPKRIIIVSFRYLINRIIAVSQRFNIFRYIKPKTYLNLGLKYLQIIIMRQYTVKPA